MKILTREACHLHPEKCSSGGQMAADSAPPSPGEAHSEWGSVQALLASALHLEVTLRNSANVAFLLLGSPSFMQKP